MFKNHIVLDAHVHCSLQTDSDYLADFLEKTNTDMANIVACSHSKAITMTPMALKMKSKYPDRFFVFTAPDVTGYKDHADDLGLYFANYCNDMMSRGCDGVKLLEGKPQMRKAYPIPDFDLPVWEAFFAWAEESGTPILWHVNDPEEFWDYKTAPSFAVSQGWLYDDTYPNNEDQYRQVLAVLERHPRLKIDFAHFFFMSAQLERLAAILDKYQNVMIDITPGIEMYENFSKDRAKALAFFEKYHDRIIYGTDIGGRCVLMGEDKVFDEAENLRRPEIVRIFLEYDGDVLVESDGHYIVGREPFVMKCLGLNDEVLDEILSRNFLRLLKR